MKRARQLQSRLEAVLRDARELRERAAEAADLDELRTLVWRRRHS